MEPQDADSAADDEETRRGKTMHGATCRHVKAKRTRRVTCAACGGAFSDVRKNQTEHHRAVKGANVGCGGCAEFGFTARSCHACQRSGACKKRLPMSAFSGNPPMSRAKKRRAP